MYTPPAFREEDPATIRQIVREARLATLVTATSEGLVATPLPLFLVEEGEFGVLYGHVAKANPQWKLPPIGEALAMFTGPDAYVTPSWYASKREHGKVVPTWNYVAVHAYGPVEFFEDAERIHDIVTRLTNFTRRRGRSPGPSATRLPNLSRRSYAASSACGCRSLGSKASGSSARTARKRTAKE